MSRTLLLASCCVALCLGCDDLSDFSTGPGEAYCGSITLGSTFRAGLSPRVQMRLTLDAGALDDPDTPPGTLSTFEAPDGAAPEQRLFAAAPLRVMPPLLHDPLSRPDLGEGRERTAVYGVSPLDPAVDPMLAFVSLLADESIEVRLLRPGVVPAGHDQEAPKGRQPVFGLFTLAREAGACGF